MTTPQPKPGARQKLEWIVEVAHAARAGGPVNAVVAHNLQCSPMSIEALASCALTMLDVLEASCWCGALRPEQTCCACDTIKAVNDKLSEG